MGMQVVAKVKAVLVRRRDETGAALVEMALSTILLLFILAGVVDFGGAFQHYVILTNAAREGARTYARLPCRADNRAAIRSAILDAAMREAAGSNIVVTAGQLSIAPDPASGCPAAGATVQMQVAFDYPLQMGNVLGLRTLTLRTQASMAYAGND
jgi:Flp pilus assembly protein TadG